MKHVVWSLLGWKVWSLLWGKLIWALCSPCPCWWQSSIQFWSGFIPVNEVGWIHPNLPAISPTPTLHLAWFLASSFFKPTLLLSSTFDLHVFLGHPRFLFPFTSNSNAFLKTSSLLMASILMPKWFAGSLLNEFKNHPLFTVKYLLLQLVKIYQVTLV